MFSILSLFNLFHNFISLLIFLKVFIGDEVKAESEITELNGLRVTASLKCFSKNEELLVEGVAKGFLPRHTSHKLS